MRKQWSCWPGVLAGVVVAGAVQAAEAGLYVGGGAGEARAKEAFVVPGGRISVDETESAYKAFLGFRFGLLGLEGGYVNFGNPKGTLSGTEVDMELTGFDLFGTLNLWLGPLGLFAKAGALNWTVEAEVNGSSVEESGHTPVYGGGALLRLTERLNARAEYEKFETDLDQLTLWSAGLELTF